MLKTFPVWQLRSRGSDGMMHDYLEATRFRNRRSIEIVNLVAGTYDLFVGIRREQFFYELDDPAPSSPKRQRSTSFVPPPSPPSSDKRSARSLDVDSELDLEEEDSVLLNPQKTEKKVVRSMRAGIGAVFTGGRKVISTVTLGKVGQLSVELEIRIIDRSGNEVLSTRELLTCVEKSNFELRLVLKENDVLQIKLRSITTLHSIYIFSNLFLVPEQEQKMTQKFAQKVELGINSLLESQTTFEKPGQMLRRAVLGSRHAERSAFARSLAFACFTSLSGFILGFFFEPSVSVFMAIFALLFWIFRIVVALFVVLFDL